MADIVASNPIALPARVLGTASATSATVNANMIAAPMPCTARAPISQPSPGASAQNNEALVKMPIPINSNRRRPKPSPRRPTLTINVVIASRYARTIHCTCWNVASNAAASVGNPALAMLVSSDGINIDSARLVSAQRAWVSRGCLGMACSLYKGHAP